MCNVYCSNNLSLQNSPLLQGRIFGGGQRYRLERLPGTLSMASLYVMSAREDFPWLRHRKTAETEKDAEDGSLKTVFCTLLLQFSIPDTLSSWELHFFFLDLEIRLKTEVAQKRKMFYSQHYIKHLCKDLVEKEREKKDEYRSVFGKPRRWKKKKDREKDKNFTVKNEPKLLLFSTKSMRILYCTTPHPLNICSQRGHTSVTWGGV